MSKNIVAWQGVAKLKRAQWDSANGYTVQFALPDPEGEDKSNPFKRFTKMRKGRVGTRFEAIIFETSDSPAQVYNDGAMLKGWTDSNTGQTVSFWLANVEGGEHPMAQYAEGDEFAIALVEMSDEDAPIDQAKREAAEEALAPEEPPEPARKEKHQQTPAEGCAMVCSNPLFWKFIGGKLDTEVASAAAAGAQVRGLLGIESRREINTNPQIAEEWDRIRRRFVKWQRSRPA